MEERRIENIKRGLALENSEENPPSFPFLYYYLSAWKAINNLWNACIITGQIVFYLYQIALFGSPIAPGSLDSSLLRSIYSERMSLRPLRRGRAKACIIINEPPPYWMNIYHS